MKIPRTPEEVRGDFLRSIISVFENFVSRHIILVRIDNCAFKFVTCSYAYGVNDIVTYTEGIRAVGILNMEIYRLGTRLFMIVETPDDFDWDAAFARLATMDKQAEWEDFVAKYQKAVPGSSSSEKWQLMECMFKLPGASK